MTTNESTTAAIKRFCEEQATRYADMAGDYEDTGFGMDKAKAMQARADQMWERVAAYREVLQEIELIEEGYTDEAPQGPGPSEEEYLDSLERDALDGPHFYDQEG